MQRMVWFSLVLLGLISGVAEGQADRALVDNALSAAPAAVAAGATVVNLKQQVIRPGTNGFTCMPDNPDVPNNAPMCLDQPWLEFVAALMGRSPPKVSRIGIAYMLQEDMPVSNIDPFAAGPTPDNQWLQNPGPHIMMIFPDPSVLNGFPTDPKQGGPYVMWKGTAYAHLMVPTEKRTSTKY